MKKTALWALPIAATLVVAGCSGGTTPDEATRPSPTGSGSAGETAPSAGPSAEPAAASPDPNDSAGKQLTANDMLAVAEAVESRYGNGGTQILRHSDLKASVPMVEKMLAGMKVSPAACGAFAMSGMTEIFDHVNMSSVVLPADSNDATTSVSMGSYKTVDDIDQVLDQARGNLENCNKFTLTVQGQKASAVVKRAKASTAAATTMANVSDVKYKGQDIKTLTVAGYDGRSNITVVIVQPKDLDMAVSEAEKYIDFTLKQMADE